MYLDDSICRNDWDMTQVTKRVEDISKNDADRNSRPWDNWTMSWKRKHPAYFHT